MHLLYHPLIPFLTSTITVSLTAAYTARSSPFRYVSLALITLCAFILPSSVKTFAGATGFFARTVAGTGFWNIVTFYDRLILRAWDYDHYGPTAEDRKELPVDFDQPRAQDVASRFPGTRMDFGSEVAGTARGTGLFWEVKNVPYFIHNRPSYVPSRTVFLFVQTAVVVACYLLHNATVKLVCNVDPKYMSPERVPLLARFPQITMEEMSARVIISLGFWVGTCTMIQCFYSIFAMLGTIANRKDIRLWRPMFGSLTDAYTVRGFWGLVPDLASSRTSANKVIATSGIKTFALALKGSQTILPSTFCISRGRAYLHDTLGFYSASRSQALCTLLQMPEVAYRWQSQARCNSSAYKLWVL